MGAAVSSNVTKQIIETSYGIANNYVNDCKTTTSATYNFLASNGCTQNLQNINLQNGSTINVSCLQNNSTQNSMKNMIRDQIVAQATAAAQSIGGPSLSFSSNVQDIAQKISEQISTDYTQKCTAGNNTTVNIVCSDPSTNQTINGLTINNTENTFNNCTSNNTTVNQQSGRLSDLIRTQTNASEVNTLGSFVAIFLIIIAIIGFFFVKTLNGPIGWIVVIIVAAIVIGLIIYAIFAFERGLYPFTRNA